jgi:hypothetical protein
MTGSLSAVAAVLCLVSVCSGALECLWCFWHGDGIGYVHRLEKIP